MGNPFVFVGTGNLSTNFIGREKEAEQMEQRAINGGMICVIGLTRMGKTTLARHVFLEEQKKQYWLEHHKIPLYISVEAYGCAIDFWGAIATSIKSKLYVLNVTPEKKAKYNEIRSLCDEAETSDKDTSIFDKVIPCLEIIKQEFGMSIILVVDELDYLLKYKYDKSVFGQLRMLSDYCCLVTCSRRNPKDISGDFHSVNPALQIYVGTFNGRELEQYWNHFSQYFELTNDDFSLYKELVARYAGCQPHFMNIMNAYAFDSGNLSEWCRMMNSSERYQLEWRFRSALLEPFKEQMNKIEEQGLKNAAIAAFLGTDRDESFDDKIAELVEKYKFLRIVSEKEKSTVFGYDFGMQTNDGKRFVCMSNFFSHYVRDQYRPLIKGAQLLYDTELKLRELIRLQLKTTYGPEALMVRNGSEYTMKYEEKWEEEYFKNKAYKESMEVKANWKTIKEIRFKNTRYEWKNMLQRPPADFLTGTTVGHLWTYFISKFWREYYSKVFDSENWREQDGFSNYLGNINNWRDHVFETFKDYRNIDRHCNRAFMTPESIEKAESACRQICKDIELWVENHARFSP